MLVENESWSHGGDKISCGRGREKEEQAGWGIAPLCPIKRRISGRSKLMKGVAKRQLTPALDTVIPWCSIYKMGCNIFALETSFFFFFCSLFEPEAFNTSQTQIISEVLWQEHYIWVVSRARALACLPSLGQQFWMALCACWWHSHSGVLQQAGMHGFCLCRWKYLLRECFQLGGGGREEVHHCQQVGNFATGT